MTDAEDEGIDVYGQYGWREFNGITATPIIIPHLEHPDSLLGFQIEFVNTIKSQTIFSEVVPLEILLPALSNLTLAISRHLKSFSTSSYKVETQRVLRSDLVNLMEAMRDRADEIAKLIPETVIDDAPEGLSEEGTGEAQ